MSESKSSSGLRVFGVICLVGLLASSALGAAVYFTWDKWGKEKWAELKENLSGDEKASASGAKRPVVASAPISADARTLAQYVDREDVLVMVEYYADS